jgi:LmbE family N-acetylglucosaminyl deacetylase
MTRTAFAIGAHPDDIEFFMAGTLLLLNDAGYEIHYMTLANGCCGSTQHDKSTISDMRRAEAMAAAESVGAVFHESLVDDLDIFYDKPTLARLSSVIREVAPEIVLTHPPVDYMEDHTNTCRLVVTAAFSRGMPNFSVDPPRPPVEGPVTVYHAQPAGNRDPLGNLVHPQIYVDVADKIDQRVAMLALHESQKRFLDETQWMDSYLETLRDLAREVGAMSGRFSYADGWRRHLHLGFCNAQDNPLVGALGDRAWVAG